MFDLINIFEIFLPQLLLYPNPTDPLNAEAAALHMKNMDKFKERVSHSYPVWLILILWSQVKEYVKKFASSENFDGLINKQKDPNAKQAGVPKAQEEDKHSETSELS